MLVWFGDQDGTGFRVSNATREAGEGEHYTDLYYVYQRYLQPDLLRQAIAAVVNDTLRIRQPHIWGEGTTACASDARKFAARVKNLLTEWHIRYRGPGVMIYWHVERNSTCIYSQLKSPSSSEVAAMIEGVLRHCFSLKLRKTMSIATGKVKSALPSAACSDLNCCHGFHPFVFNGCIVPKKGSRPLIPTLGRFSPARWIGR